MRVHISSILSTFLILSSTYAEAQDQTFTNDNGESVEQKETLVGNTQLEQENDEICKRLNEKVSKDELTENEADQWLACLPIVDAPFSGENPKGLNAHSPKEFPNGNGWRLFPEFNTEIQS